MRKLSLIIFYIALLILTSNSQTPGNKIRGTVTDDDKKPIEFVSVTVQDIGISTSTNGEGNFEFAGIPPGNYLLIFKRSGYESKTLEASFDGRDTLINISLSESLIETPVIDVTSSFKASEVSKSTFSVTELNGRNLTKQRSQTLAETIENIPGLSSVSTGVGIGKPVIRGLSSQSVLIVHDGVKQESQMWGDEHGPEISLFDLDRIEILRGPASLVYGADGIGGVVNVITKPLEFSNKSKPVFYGEAVLGGFSVNNQGLGNLTLGIGTKNFGLKGHFGYRQAQDTKTPEGTFDVNTLSGIRTINGGKLFNSGSKEVQGGANFGLNQKFGNVNLSFDIFNRQVQIHEDPEIDPEASPNQKLNTSQFSFNGSFNITKKLKLEPVLSYQMQERKEFESKEDKEANITALDLKINTLDGSLKLNHEISEKISGTVGLSFTGQNNETLGEEKLIPNYDANTFGAYVLEKINTKRFTFSLGGRFDTKRLNIKETVFEADSAGNPLKVVRTQDINFNAVSGSFGIAYLANEYVNAYMNIGRGWRPPSEYELFADGIHEGTFRYDRGLRTQNPGYDPKPEESINIDIGVRVDYKNFNLQVSGYRNEIFNFVYPSATTDTLEGFPVYDIKQDKSSFIGYEYTVQFQPAKWLVLSANGDYVKTKNEATNNPLPFTPPMKNIFELKLQKQHMGKLLNPYIKFGTKLVSAQNDVDPLEAATKGYTLLNAGIGFDFALAKSVTSVDFTVDNIAGTKYVDHLSRYKSYALNPGRSFNLQVSVPFRF
ncbi:MAG TPA: TonB-dependent receptor [Ignavibacteria bacterium]|jgi:iron complex outermembrane receptor protein